MWTSPVWFYRGEVGQQEFGGVGQFFYTATSTGQFELCILGDQVGCIGQVFAQAEVTALASGGWTFKGNWR